MTKGDQQILDQIEKQLNKLEDVVDIKRLDPDNSCLVYTSRCV